MRETPVEDFFSRNGKLRQDGLMVHDLYLVQVLSTSIQGLRTQQPVTLAAGAPVVAGARYRGARDCDDGIGWDEQAREVAGALRPRCPLVDRLALDQQHSVIVEA
jgi:hypothetical protein